MIDSKILVSVVIVLLIGVAAAGYQISNTTQGLWQPVKPTTPDTSQQSSDSVGTDTGSQQSSASSVSTSSSSKSSGSGSSNVISSSKAKSIAQNFIKQEGATAGTPKLITSNGKQMYLVPVMMNGNQVGEIYIDAKTGENLGGAGGAP
ncbi:MAG: PepSY domain-containing protein [Methanobacteriaceae archaeon]|nr:PepSY domain-containing protein [Methanobacteriaceae archaeon]